MQWIEKVTMELDRMSVYYDINYSKIFMDLEEMKVTTTSRSTKLIEVVQFFFFFLFKNFQIEIFFQSTTKFKDVWANKYFFDDTLKQTLEKYPNFSYEYNGPRNKIPTKPNLIYLENYDIQVNDEL